MPSDIKYRGGDRHYVAAFMLTALLLVSSAPIFAQSAPATGSDNPPAPAPTVRDFTLPPGPSAAAPAPRAEGPIDENGRAPRPATRAPTSPAANSPAPTTQTPPSQSPVIAPNSSVRTPPVTQPVTQPAARPNPEQNRTIAAEPRPSNSAQPASTQSSQEQLEDSGTDTASPETPNVSRADSAPAPVPEVQQDRQNTVTTNDTSLWYWIAGGTILLILAAALYFWRKRTEPEAKGRLAGLAKSKPSMPRPETSTVTPLKNAKPIHNDKAAPVPSTPTAHSFILDFTVESASCTLINAVVKYRLLVRGKDGALTDKISSKISGEVNIHGTLLQADATALHSANVAELPLLHHFNPKDVKGLAEFTGELRLPLSTIDPFVVRQQALFIPLVRFALQWIGENGAEQLFIQSFLIGREHEPPRVKMAPLRLDLGPRSYRPVGHRVLEPA